MLEIDHIIYAVLDLDKAAQKFAAMGLESVFGGTHPTFGTANRIVPFDGSYVELMSVVDAEVAAENPLGTWLSESTSRGDTLVALCARTGDLDGVARRLNLSVTPGSRVKPDGARLSWRLAGVEAAIQKGLPFFIAWDNPNIIRAATRSRTPPRLAARSLGSRWAAMTWRFVTGSAKSFPSTLSTGRWGSRPPE